MASVKEYIDHKQDEIIKTLQRLIAIPSVRGEASPGKPFGEQPALALQEMLQICENFGLKTKNFDNYMGTAVWGDAPVLGILVHLDVVPAGSGWSMDPFAGIVKDGKVYGRGAIDDKGPAVSVLYALLAVIQAGYAPKGGVKLIFGTNEESGTKDLTYYLTQEEMPPLLFAPDSEFPVINIEKGMLQIEFSAEFSSNDPTYLEFHCGEAVNAISGKSSATMSGHMQDEWTKLVQQENFGCTFSQTMQQDVLQIECVGKAAHAAFPENGNNPLTALLGVLCRSSLAGEKMELLRKINQLFPHNDVYGNHSEIACSDEESGALTLSFSKLHVDQKGLTGCIDIRFPVCASYEPILHHIKNLLESAGCSIRVLYAVQPHKVAADSELVQKLLQAYEQVTGNPGACRSIGGGTYVHNLNGVVFGAERPGIDYHMHGADEFLPISELLTNTEIYAKAIELLATEPA